MPYQPLTVLLLFIAKCNAWDWENKLLASLPKSELGEGGESNYSERLPGNKVGNKWKFIFPVGATALCKMVPHCRLLVLHCRSGHGALPASRGRGRNCRSRWELKDALGRKYKIPPDGKFFLFETSLSGTKFSFFLLLWVFQKKWGSIRRLNWGRAEDFLFFAALFTCFSLDKF